MFPIQNNDCWFKIFNDHPLLSPSAVLPWSVSWRPHAKTKSIHSFHVGFTSVVTNISLLLSYWGRQGESLNISILLSAWQLGRCLIDASASAIIWNLSNPIAIQKSNEQHYLKSETKKDECNETPFSNELNFWLHCKN